MSERRSDKDGIRSRREGGGGSSSRRSEGGEGSGSGSRRKDKGRKGERAQTIGVASGVEMLEVRSDMSPVSRVAELKEEDQLLQPPSQQSSPSKRSKILLDKVEGILDKVDVLSQKTNNLFAKKGRAGEYVRGTHLSRLVKESGLSPVQVQALANEFNKRVPSGRMTIAQFKKDLMFDAKDEFGSRLFRAFTNSDPDELTMDEFIIGISRFAPRAKLDTKIDSCYDLFDVDRSGGVTFDEFEEVATYSLNLARVGVSQEKLKQVINAEWTCLDVDGDGSVTRKEFQQHMLQNKEFVNALTIHVPWVQEAFRKAEAKPNKSYLDTEPMISVLGDLAIKVGAKIDDANKWCAVLKDNFFTDVASLKDITQDDWTSMNLPRRLYTIMNQLLYNRSENDNAVFNKVSRRVLKTHNNFRFHMQRKKLQIIWLIIYFMGMAAITTYTLIKFLTNWVGEEYYQAYLLLSPSLVVSRVFGALLKLNFSLMLLPVCYRTLTWMRSTKLDHYIPIDSLMFFHRYVGASLLVYGIAHTAGHFVNFYHLSHSSVEDINNVFGHNFVTSTPSYGTLFATRTGATGLIMIISMLIMIPLAHEKVRRMRFNTFFSSHHLYFVIYVCAALHDGLLFRKIEIVYWLLPSMLLFVCERLITLFRAAKTYEVVEGTMKHKGDVLELRFERPAWYNYSAGHYTWINCPTVSGWQWHPFTLTSSPDQEYLSVHINLVGDWTKPMGLLCAPPKGSAAHKQAITEEEEGRIVLPKVRIDGPYGTASGDVFMYSHVILVGGGIGVTPFVSILKSIAHKVRFENTCSLQGVHFIWVAKSQENFEWFIPILAEMMEHEELHGFLKVSVYLTGTRHAINDLRLLGMTMLIKRAKAMLGEDLVTGLEASTTFGRPDFQKILLQANNEWAGNKIGCFFCGPAPLANSIKVTCEAINKANRGKKTGAKFNFKQEFF